MSGRVEVHGYAIVSDDDRIADAGGQMPAALRNEEDWRYFQSELDGASLTILGRIGHEANPNTKGRTRMVLTGAVRDLERRGNDWWWNPAGLSWSDAAATALPQGGRVAVPGGRRVFDLFLDLGYHAFHLTRAEGVKVPGGIPLFSACMDGRSAEAVLARHGLKPGPRQILDQASAVSLVVWRR